MRTKRTLLNMAYALGSSLLLLLLGLVTRRLLVDNFGPQITTASQVVSQLFNFFSIAEFGVGSVISYRLYEQIAAKNEEKISKYMSMYKWAYRVVGLVIAGLALIGAAALRWIMPDVPAATAYTVYGLNVVSTLCSYFLITRRLMYTCTQQGYRCTQIDFCCNVLTSLAKIAVLNQISSNTCNVKRRARFPDQKHLKLSVIQRHVHTNQSFKTSDRGRIGHHSQNKFLFQFSLLPQMFPRKAHPVGFKPCQAFDSFQHICLMPQNIFRLLRGRIGYLRKCSERRHIDEISVFTEYTDIHQKWFSQRSCLRRFPHIFRKSQTGCEIIRGTRRDIS